MRTFVRGNTGESTHVPERAKQIFRENQRDTVKFKEYTFLVEKKQCKEILLQHLHTKISTTNHITLEQQQYWGQTALSDTVTVNTPTPTHLCIQKALYKISTNNLQKNSVSHQDLSANLAATQLQVINQ